MFTIGIATAVALGQAASKYEGSYREDDEEIHLFLTSKGGTTISHSVPTMFLPKTAALRDKYIAYTIRQMVTMLDDKISQAEKFIGKVGQVPCLR